MAGSTCVFVVFMLTNVILINSQDNRIDFPWSWLTTMSPGASEELDRDTEDHRPINEETAGQTHQEPLTPEKSASAGNQGLTNRDSSVEASTRMMISGTWTEDMFSGVTDSTTQLFQLKIKTQNGRNSCNLDNVFVFGVLFLVISFFGLISNSLCILVFWPDRNKSASTVLLLQLAVIDTGVLIIWSVMLMTNVMAIHSDAPAGLLRRYPYIYKYGWGMSNMIQMISVYLIVYITAQRYVAVCHPHKMRVLGSVRMAWLQLAVLVSVSILFNIPRVLEVYVVVREDGRVGLRNTELRANNDYLLWYKNIAFYVIQFILPVGLLIFFTLALIRKLRKPKIKGKVTVGHAAPSAISGPTITRTTTDTAPGPTGKPKATKGSGADDVTFALIVVDIVFILCQLLNPLRRLTDFFVPKENQGCGTPYTYWRALSPVGVFLNSATNFLIFCVCGKGFRSLVIQRLSRKKSSVGPGSKATEQVN